MSLVGGFDFSFADSPCSPGGSDPGLARVLFRGGVASGLEEVAFFAFVFLL